MFKGEGKCPVIWCHFKIPKMFICPQKVWFCKKLQLQCTKTVDECLRLEIDCTRRNGLYFECARTDHYEWFLSRIGHFRVAVNLITNARLSAKLFM